MQKTTKFKIKFSIYDEKSVLYVVIAIITSLAGCQNKSTSKKTISNAEIIIEKPECEIFYNKYIDKVAKMESDSAMYFLNKSIYCDPANNDYKFVRAQFLVENQKYQEAIHQLNEIKFDSIDPTLKFFSAVLKLKLKNSDADKDLNEVYAEMGKIKEPTSNNLFYKIALDNYFKGKEYSLIEVTEFKEKYKGKSYEEQNISALEELIKKESKETVLFKVFNIR